MLFDSLRLSSTPKEEEWKEEEENKNKEEHKKITFLLFAEMMKKRRRLHRYHSQHKSLSYLHESQSNLYLQRNKNYIK